MPRAGIDDEFFAFDLEHKAVGFVDMHAPPTRKVAFERFRLANATIAVSVNALKKGVDAFCHSGVDRNDFANCSQALSYQTFFMQTTSAERVFFGWSVFSAAYSSSQPGR